jgi:hypothetical protein
MVMLANAGVPMLIVVGPVLVLALLPILLVEAGLYWRRVGVPWGRAVLGSLGANAISTLVGVPLTWLALVVLQMTTGGGGNHGIGIQAVTWQAPWLLPDEDHLHWMIPAAGAVLCLPFFLASVLIEGLFLRQIWKEFDRASVRSACWLVNGLTYGGLVVVWMFLLIVAVLD